MKRFGIYLLFLLTSTITLYSQTESDCSNAFKPKNLEVDASKCITISTSTTTICGRNVIVKWLPTYSALKYWNGIFPVDIYFTHYHIDICPQGAANVLKSYDISNINTTSCPIDYFSTDNLSGVYDIKISAIGDRYVVSGLIYALTGAIVMVYWDSWSSSQTSITAVIDHTPPPRPVSSLQLPNGQTQTNENSKGPDGNSGYVTIIFNAVPDAGPLINFDSSGVAGYKVYEETSPGQFTYIPGSGFLSSTAPGSSVQTQIQLLEGKHNIAITAFDNIALLENNGVIPTTGPGIVESQCSIPTSILVDRTGPEAVSINTSGFIPVTGKPLRFAGKNSGIGWDTPHDPPQVLNSDGTISYKGSGAVTYSCTLANANPEEAQPLSPSPTTSRNLQVPDTLVSGKYSLVIQPIDAVGNASALSTCTSVQFYVDNTLPQAINPDSFAIINDTLAQKISSANFQTKQKTCTLSFDAVSDGYREYDSGTALYRVYKGDAKVYESGSPQITVNNLSPGPNIFTVKAVDAVGNESQPVSLAINLPTLQPVTFPTPCYILNNNIYYLLWNAPVDANGTADIVYYKVIVQGRSQAAPGYSDFSGKDQVTDLRYSLDGVDQGADLAAYVLAVAYDNSWSIGSKEFSLPPLNGTGNQPRTLTEDEYWGPGIYDLNQSIIVPAGKTLHILDGTTIRIHGAGDIFIQIIGILDSVGGSTGITYRSAKGTPGTKDWKGIIASGEVDLQKSSIQNAERGLTALPGAMISINSGEFLNCRIGIHAGTAASVTGTHFENCEWYAVKEDDITGNLRPHLVNCTFKKNGSIYYHMTMLILNIDQLNDIGNSGNSEEK